MTPEMVGAPDTELVLGKHSGKHGLAARYKALGYVLTPEELKRVARDFKELADRKKTVLDEDLLSILHHEVMEDVPEVHRLASLDVRCGGEVSSATVTIESAGEARTAEGSGDGPIAAAFVAIDSAFDTHIVLERFTIRAATPGRDALGEVSIQARIDGHTFTGRGAHTDVVRASAEAFLHAINKAAAPRARGEGQMATTPAIGGV
jgi:2-isopropylmalate synthase